MQTKLAVTDPPKGTSIIAREFSPGKPEPTPINEIWQKTEDITQSSLEFDEAQEFDVEKGQVDLEAGVEKASEKELQEKLEEKLEELVKETERDAAIFAQALQAQIVQGEIEIETIGRKIVIRIREKGSFKSGSATLTEKYYQVLEEVAAVLAKQPGRVQVQGHTDNIPIKTRRFRSNWELSTARAVSVAHALMVGKKVKQSRFEV
ncbi:MAG: OmpA family protein, partial [Cellvibrionaceae bacterium]|nr:OmpA family protein [Cellvibrionaceae bacterium]